MAHQSYAKTVLEMLTRIVNDVDIATVTDVSHNLGIQTAKDHKRMLNALSDLCKAGKVRRVSQGVYTVAERASKQPQVREVMWRFIRMNRRATVEDLMEVAGASVEYAREWLRTLVKRRVVRKISHGPNKPCTWQLVNDTVEMPQDEEKASKLRELRRKKKQQAMADLAAARKLIGKAHRVIKEMEE